MSKKFIPMLLLNVIKPVCIVMAAYAITFVFPPVQYKTVFGALHVMSTIVNIQTTDYIVMPLDCGTTIRDIGDLPHHYILPDKVPLGCRIEVIQEGDGLITYLSDTKELKQFGPKPLHMTLGKYSRTHILADTTESYILTGQVQ